MSDHFHQFQENHLSFSPETSINIINCSMRTYGGYHKVPGYISTFPPLSHPVRGPFTPFDSFWYRIKLWSAKPSIRTKKFFMIVFGGCRKVHSICQTSNTLIHHVEGVFPPKYDIFKSDSAKSQVSALETNPWLYMVAIMRCLAICIPPRPFSTLSEAFFRQTQHFHVLGYALDTVP